MDLVASSLLLLIENCEVLGCLDITLGTCSLFTFHALKYCYHMGTAFEHCER